MAGPGTVYPCTDRGVAADDRNQDSVLVAGDYSQDSAVAVGDRSPDDGVGDAPRTNVPPSVWPNR